ncbi:Thiosulfate sulfurtransferase GlpE [bioreactor metagenome]|uniref:Thiosulfate sulfurtransferase GlpE n=1 Tax=bioreactor metagenome TaxID=1076179 RepID=A0A645GZ31_9ZZZZ
MSIFDLFGSVRDINKGVETYKKTPGAVLVDVRTREEYAYGHIDSSVNIPLDQISKVNYSKETPLFVYCQSGSRGSAACTWLNQNGFHATNIGGIMNYRGAIKTGGNR